MTASAMRMRRAVKRRAFRLDDGTFRDHEMADMGRSLALWVANEADQGVGIEIDNVLAYLLGKHKQTIELAEFQAARPPWDRCWLEGDMPGNTGIPRAAIRVSASHDASSILRTNDTMRASFPTVMNYTTNIDEGQTLLVSLVWVWHPGYRAVVGPEAGAYAVIESDGSVARAHDGEFRAVCWCFDTSGNDAYQSAVTAIALYVPLFTFEFANCHNVRLVEETEAVSRQVRRQKARDGEPLDRWYTLEIGGETVRRVAAESTNEDMARLPKRLHICRGHFATYTETAPLFGKLVGRFWVPAHVRGNADAGLISKDYRIKAPAQEVADA